MPDFKGSKNRLMLLLRANAAGDFKLKPMLIYHSDNLWVLRNYAKSTLSVLYKWNKAWMTAHLFTTWFVILRPLLKSTAQKKDSFQNITSH